MSRKVNENLLKSLPTGRLILLPKQAHDTSGYSQDGVHLKDTRNTEESVGYGKTRTGPIKSRTALETARFLHGNC